MEPEKMSKSKRNLPLERSSSGRKKNKRSTTVFLSESDIPNPFIPLSFKFGAPFMIVFRKTKKGTYKITRVFHGTVEVKNRRGIFYLPFIVHSETLYEGPFKEALRKLVKIVKPYRPDFNVAPEQ
ncbi:MAG: hypothetical protein QW179_03485 [Candidatus Hadarchaeales archaeon]